MSPPRVSFGELASRRSGSTMVCSRQASSTPMVVFCESAGPGLPCGSADSTRRYGGNQRDDVRFAPKAIDDKSGFGRLGTTNPSRAFLLGARRQRFCCFRCLVICRSGTASGKWTPRSKPELCRLSRSTLLAHDRWRAVTQLRSAEFAAATIQVIAVRNLRYRAAEPCRQACFSRHFGPGPRM